MISPDHGISRQVRIPSAAVRTLAALMLFFFHATGAEKPCHAQAVQTPYRLIGTIAGAANRSAVIEEKSTGQTVYHEQEQLPDGSRIKRIMSDRITLVGSDGTSYDLYINSSFQLQNPAAQPEAGSLKRIEPAVVQPADPTNQRLDPERRQRRKRNRSRDE